MSRPPYRPAPAARPTQTAPLERGDTRIQRAMATLRADDAFAAAAQCPACLAERAQLQDPQALCDDHLARALGVSGGWDQGPPGKKL